MVLLQTVLKGERSASYVAGGFFLKKSGLDEE